MDADFHHYHRLDLAECVWGDTFPVQRLWSFMNSLPSESAYRRAKSLEWTVERELLSRITDLAGISSRGKQPSSKFEPVERPGSKKSDRTVDPRRSEDRGAITAFFGRR